MLPSTSPHQAMIRGSTPSFKNIEGDEQTPPSSPSPGRSKKKKTNSSSSSSKNPYSTRGLDKFSTVLGELEARRTRIMEKADGGVSMVKFAYSNSSSDWIPLVVRQRSSPPSTSSSPPPASSPPQPAKSVEESVGAPLPAAAEGSKVSEKNQKMNGGSKGLGVEKVKEWVRRKWREDQSCYWGVAMILVLFCLVMFGRVFAVCSMLVWWYLAPVVHGEGWDAKGHGRRTSNGASSGTARHGGRSSLMAAGRH